MLDLPLASDKTAAQVFFETVEVNPMVRTCLGMRRFRGIIFATSYGCGIRKVRIAESDIPEFALVFSAVDPGYQYEASSVIMKSSLVKGVEVFRVYSSSLFYAGKGLGNYFVIPVDEWESTRKPMSRFFMELAKKIVDRG